MPIIRWYFDFLSPFAWLQWCALQPGRGRFVLEPVPILFAAVLDHLGQRGPAEIPGKREFIYRLVQWQAEQAGVPLRFPPAHPFNPVTALRLAVAADARIEVIDSIFRLIWVEGRLPEPAALSQLASRHALDDVPGLVQQPAVKARLRDNTAAAIARGVYGVPTAELHGELYWGNDATGMVLQALESPQCWSAPHYQALRTLPVAAARPRSGDGAS